MKLSVIRHGETIENARGIVQGQLPGELSGRGIVQAQKAAESIHGQSFDYVYCSDLKRCVDTAQYLLINHQDISLVHTSDLREISFGIYQGKHVDEIPDWESTEGDFYTRQLPAGETINEFRSRTVRFVNQLFSRHADDHLLVVTHGGNMRIIKSVIEGIDLWELYQSKPGNCELWEFDVTELLENS
ncbi:alpha-ribazole phosphatase [soil metagenome]